MVSCCNHQEKGEDGKGIEEKGREGNGMEGTKEKGRIIERKGRVLYDSRCSLKNYQCKNSLCLLFPTF